MAKIPAIFAFVLALAVSSAISYAQVPWTPYGMDAVPDSDFYRAAWDRYGSDPVPRSDVDEYKFVDVYGLDGIPDSFVPTLHEIKHLLPHETLVVLTRAIEGSELQGPTSPPRNAPKRGQ